jgi:hypothetical protein
VIFTDRSETDGLSVAVEGALGTFIALGCNEMTICLRTSRRECVRARGSSLRAHRLVMACPMREALQSTSTRLTGLIRPSVPRQSEGTQIAARDGAATPSDSVERQCVFDPSLGGLVLAIKALGIDLEKYVDAVARPLRDLGGGDAGIEPGGEAGVTQVVGAAR